MAVYLLVDTAKTTDPQMFAEYAQRVVPTLETYGVKILVGGGMGYETIEGNWQAASVTLLEFEDREHFERWYDSPEYQEIRPIRMQATSGREILTREVRRE